MSIKSTFAFIDQTTLTTDIRVQRPIDMVRVNELAVNFNADQIGTIIVSERADGTRVTLDGQTRLAAKTKVGNTSPTHAQIYTGLSLEQEASMFLAYNNSKPVSSLDRFLVRVTEGDATAVAISAILARHGWRVRSGGGSDGTFTAVAAIERAYIRAGTSAEHVVDSTIETITKAWGHDTSGMNASLVGGLAELFQRYGVNVDRQKLVREFQATTPRTLLGRARGMKESRVISGSLPLIVGRVIHTMHNQKLRKNHLPDWK